MLRSIYFKGGIEARKQKTTNWQCLCITLFYFEALAKYKAQFFVHFLFMLSVYLLIREMLII